MRKTVLISLFSFMCWRCTEPEVLPTTYYDQPPSFADSSAEHPKASVYQSILEQHQRQGLVGATLLVKDQNGLWIGAAGYSDIANDVPMEPDHVFFIASISKVFTASAVYRYIDQGLLSFDDKISQWLSDEVIDNVENSDQATIAHLLSHRSGILDFYTNQFDLDRLNADQKWTKEEVLTYIYGKPAEFEIDASYSYSNTNFLLLSMILEQVSGKSFEELYQEEVFNPLNLSSAYYSEEQIIPEGVVKGYVDLYDNKQFVESTFLYEDELGIGGDGGVAINAYHLAVFLENLVNDSFISASSQALMTDWFPLPEDYHWDEYGQTDNGYGLERFNTKYESAFGHTGGIDGFSTYGFYFPESDMTYVLLCNSASLASGDIHASIFEKVLNEMFNNQ
ncbi:MAG: serine hydrolase domain-containing protein [Cyclobacteriaceae bacterium]